MAVDPDIQQRAAEIRSADYGWEITETIANGLESMSEDVVNTEGRQTDVETQFQAVMDAQAEIEPSGVEVGAARVDSDGVTHPNLKARLDDKEQEFTAQLAQRVYYLRERKPDEVNDDNAFQEAIDTGRPIVIKNRGYDYLITKKFSPQNSIYGEGFPKITAPYGDGSGDHLVFEYIGVNNFEVTGLHIVGNYKGESVTGNLNEYDHALRIFACDNVKIHDNIIEDMFGDCIAVGSDSTNPVGSTNVHIFRNKLINPRRCIVAFVDGEGLYIRDNDMVDSYGYVGSIVLEPNPNDWNNVSDVYIENNTFDSHAIFTKLHNPNPDDRPIENVFVRHNTGKATVMVGANTGKGVNVNVEHNDFSDFVGEPSRFIVVTNVDELTVKGNTDRSTGGAGVGVTRCSRITFTDNIIDAVRTIGVSFYNTQYVRFLNNLIKDVSSGSGSVIFGGTEDQFGHQIIGNKIDGANYGIIFKEVVYTDVVLSNNVIESSGRGINIALDSDGSDISIDQTNTFTGLGTPVFGYDFLTKWKNPEIRIKGAGVYWGTAIPTTGTWVRGDIMFNSLPNGGTQVGWACIQGGSPGAWRAFGQLEV